MQSTLERLLGLNQRELQRAWPLFGYLFLTMAGSVASKAARDALFLRRFRATDLPYVDIAIAVLAALCAALYIRIGHRTNLRNLQVGALLFFSTTALGLRLWTARTPESGPLLVTIYVWVGVLSVLAPSQVWMLANRVLTTREAKRSFGLIGSGAILGWVVGGLAAREIASRFGTESMLVLIAISTLLCAGLVVVIWGERPDHVGADQPASGPERRGGGLRASFRIVSSSPYLSSIAILVLVSALTTTVAGWQFKAMAKAAIPDTDRLAMFFGSFNMIAGLVSLVLQLILTGRVLRSAGVGVALFIVPGALIVSSLGLLALGTLIAASILKASDQVLRYSIDKATVELLYLPVPAAQTFRVKSFIDLVVYRLGDATGGLVVLLFGAALAWTPVRMSWVCLALLVVWIAAAAVARRQYVETLRESIHQHRVDTERASLQVIDRDTSALIASRLKGSPGEIAYALRLFEMAHDRVVHPAVRGLLRHAEPEIRRHAISVLARAGDLTVKDEIRGLLRDPALDVRTEALLYLTAFDDLDPLARIDALGDFEDFSIRAAVVAFLARDGRAQNLDAAHLLLGRMVGEKGSHDQRTRLEAARLLAFLPDVFDRELRDLIADEDADVARAAIATVGRLHKRSMVGHVMEHLAEPDLRDAATDALAQFGDRIVGTLRDYLLDDHMPIEARRQVPLVLQAIGTRSAHELLTESVFDSDVVLRYHSITALNKLAQQHPDRPVDSKLVESIVGAEIMGHYRSYQMLGTMGAADDVTSPVVVGLRESMEKEAERIFRLLKIIYPERDLHSAYVGLRSSDPVVHDNAVEFLDAVLAPEMRQLIIPLVDRDVTLTRRIEAANRLLGAGLADREEAIEVMTLSTDPWLRSCAAYAIGELRLRQFAEVLDRWASDADPLLRATAIDAQEKLRHTAAADAGVDAL